MILSNGNATPRQRKHIPQQYAHQTSQQEEESNKGNQSGRRPKTLFPWIYLLLLLIVLHYRGSKIDLPTKERLPQTYKFKGYVQEKPRVIFLHQYQNQEIPNLLSGGRIIRVYEMSFAGEIERDNSPAVRSDSEQTGCPFIAPYQSSSPKSTCNSIHEVGLSVESLLYLDSGGFKDVWNPLKEDGSTKENFILKTTRYSRGFGEKSLDKHRRDALVMDEATKSPNVLNLFAYCAFSNIVERAQGTLSSWLENNRKDATPETLMRLALQVADGVEQSHLYHNGRATIAHADIKSSQFLFVSSGGSDPVLKLNDFNRCRFLTANFFGVCNFFIPNKHNGSTMRSPEEYMDHGGQTDKIDVFSTGSVFYHILSGEVPFKDYEFRKAVKNIKSGAKLPLSNKIISNPRLFPLIDAMDKCRQLNPKSRPTSKDVARLLR